VAFDPDRTRRLMLNLPTHSWHRSFPNDKVLRHELVVLHAQLNKSGTTIVAYTATTEQSGSVSLFEAYAIRPLVHEECTVTGQAPSRFFLWRLGRNEERAGSRPP